MRTLLVGVFVCALSLEMYSQLFGAEPDTILPVFATSVEQEAYEFLERDPYLSHEYLVLERHPLTLRIWSPRGGWDVVTFLLLDGVTTGYHAAFDGSRRTLAQGEILQSLQELLKKKSPE